MAPFPTRLLPIPLLLIASLACEGDPSGPAPAAATAADSVTQLTNEARAASSLGALARDPALDAVAFAHARDMAVRRYFSHTSPDGTTFTQRLRNAGVNYGSAGENIAGNASAQGAVQAWLGSPGHRANMLNGSFGRIGVGVHREADSPYTYYVQVFTN
jgi:uncharacterized protein YkwD